MLARQEQPEKPNYTATVGIAGGMRRTVYTREDGFRLVVDSVGTDIAWVGMPLPESGFYAWFERTTARLAHLFAKQLLEEEQEVWQF